MGFIAEIVCTECGQEWSHGFRQYCPACGGVLVVDCHYDRVPRHLWEAALNQPTEGLWQYKALLPVEDEKHIVSLREGGTPLLKLEHLARECGAAAIFAKDETRNPTGSFKDRPTSVGMSKAVELGAEMFVIASSGNGGASVAAYAAKAGKRSFIFVPENTPISKVSQAVTYGGQVVRVRGNYSNSYNLAVEVSKAHNCANLTSTFQNPYTLEGDKTVSFELYSQLQGQVPDFIIVPIGAGPLLYGIYKGYVELQRLGLVEKTPAMIGVQAENCSPIVQAFERGSLTVQGGQTGPTIASAIADPLVGYEQDGTITLKAIYESGGLAVSVNDREVVDAVLKLGRTEGLYVEPASAAAWAAYVKLLRAQKIRKDQTAVLMLTGSGLKQPLPDAELGGEIPLLEPSLADFERYVG